MPHNAECMWRANRFLLAIKIAIIAKIQIAAFLSNEHFAIKLETAISFVSRSIGEDSFSSVPVPRAPCENVNCSQKLNFTKRKANMRTDSIEFLEL